MWAHVIALALRPSLANAALGVRFPLWIGLGLCLLASATGKTQGQPEKGAPATKRSKPKEPAAKPITLIEHKVRMVEGWTVYVDVQLLKGKHEGIGKKALRILANKLYRIAQRLPADRVAKLRAVPIYLDLHHPLRAMQYHPGAGWLRKHGYDEKMTRAVHLPRAQRLIDMYQRNTQPWVILHELAHAYHDRELGFDNKRIIKVYDRVVQSKKFDSVLHSSGRKQKHYALTNHKEFFAEMTECFFGTNDFYPFVRAELAQVAPEVVELLKEVWLAPIPKPDPKKAGKRASPQNKLSPGLAPPTPGP